MPRPSARLALVAGGLLAAVLPGLARPQSPSANRPAQGRILVADPRLTDPNFTQTVVLLVHYDAEDVVGLVLNRPTSMTVARVFSGLEAAQARQDFAAYGGPVHPTQIFGLLRAPAAPAGADLVVDGLSLLATKTLLDHAIGARTGAEALRIYLGYSGWANVQLAAEIKAGGWYVFPFDAAAAFDPHPETLWTRYIRRTQGTIAATRPGSQPPGAEPEWARILAPSPRARW